MLDPSLAIASTVPQNECHRRPWTRKLTTSSALPFCCCSHQTGNLNECFILGLHFRPRCSRPNFSRKTVPSAATSGRRRRSWRRRSCWLGQLALSRRRYGTSLPASPTMRCGAHCRRLDAVQCICGSQPHWHPVPNPRPRPQFLLCAS